MIVLLLFSLNPTTGCKRKSEVHMKDNADSIFPTFALKGAQEINKTGHLTAWSNIAESASLNLIVNMMMTCCYVD